MPAGSILLGDVAQHLASADVSCNFCERRGKVSIARLMSEHGPEMPIPTLLRMLSADCPRRLAAQIVEPCGVHLPALADVFGAKGAAELLSADCPRRLAARIAEPCGVHLPALADVFGAKGR